VHALESALTCALQHVHRDVPTSPRGRRV
jgi:hypothetical protein